MRIIALTIITMTMVTAANAAGPAPTVSDLSRNSEVVAAMTLAWEQSGGSLKQVEAGFRLDCWQRCSVVFELQTGQQMHQSMQIVPGATIAIYHVHPMKADGRPSQADRRVADTYGIQVYTMHLSGLYVYNPATKQITKLSEGLNWMK